MAIARLLHALGSEAEAAYEMLHFLERQGGMERLRKELPLFWIGTGGVGSNEMLKFFQSFWAKQIANKQASISATDTHDLREAIERLRDMVDDAIRNDG